MPSGSPSDLPINMNLAGYHVDSSMGGVSMESSCETRLRAGNYLLEKYQIPSHLIIPIEHNVKYLSNFIRPVNNFDCLFYEKNTKY